MTAEYFDETSTPCAWVAPTHLRGTLGSVNQLVICFGILGALVCNIVIPATQWRTIFALTAIPPVLLFLGELLVSVRLTHLCILARLNDCMLQHKGMSDSARSSTEHLLNYNLI